MRDDKLWVLEIYCAYVYMFIGPMFAGELKAEVRHVASGRLIPVTVSQKDASHYYIDFVPDQVGDYLINIYWTDTPIPNSPIR